MNRSNHHALDDHPRGFWRSRHAIGLLVMGTGAASFLLSEHRVRYFGALPLLLMPACPLMHGFIGVPRSAG